MTYVLGIDPSLTCTGMAVVCDAHEPDTWKCQTNSRACLSSRLADIKAEAIMAASYCGEPPALICIERPFGGGRAATAAAAPVLGAAYGAVLLGLHEALQGTETPVLTVPGPVRCKYATGKGNANKDAVLAAAIRRFGYEGSNNNEADALIFAWIAAEVWYQKQNDTNGNNAVPFKYPSLPNTHYDAIDKWEQWERVF